MAEKEESREDPKTRLMRMDRAVLEDMAIQIGCLENPNLVSKETLVERILGSTEFRDDYHLAPVTTLEWLVHEKAVRKRLETLDARFEEKVEPLRRISRNMLTVFATIGTVATVLIGISSLSGFNLNERLQEQHITFEQSLKQLEEDRRDLEKVRDELRRERRDQQRQWASLHDFYLKGEISRFQKTFERILYISLLYGQEELTSVLEQMGYYIEQWKDLVRSTDSAPLETRQDMKIIEMQIEFIEAVRQFADWNKSKPTQAWSETREKWTSVLTNLWILQPEYPLRVKKQKFLDELDQAPADVDFRSFEEAVEKSIQDDVINQDEVKNFKGGLRKSHARYKKNEETGRFFRKALAYTHIILAEINRLSPLFDKNAFYAALKHAKLAVLFDSSNGQVYGELARVYRTLARHADKLENDRNFYYENAALAFTYALQQPDVKPGLEAKDELILLNNLAYTYMEWAQYSSSEPEAQKHIEQGLATLANIEEERFNATGKIREYALITRAELEIFKLLVEIVGYAKLETAWQRDTRFEPPEEPLHKLYKDFIDKTKQEDPAMYEAWVDDLQIPHVDDPEKTRVIYLRLTHDRVQKIYNDLALTEDFGKDFFRGKDETELQSNSPQLYAFAKLVKKSSDLFGVERAPEIVKQQQEQNLYRLLGDISDMFQLKEAEKLKHGSG